MAVQVSGRFSANNLGLLRALAEQGMGVAMLPLVLVHESLKSKRLVQVLPACDLPPLPVHAVMTSRLQPASVRAFVDYLVQESTLR